MFIWHRKINKKRRQTKFTYNGQGRPFDRKGNLSFDNDYAGNVAIFGVDNSSASHTDNQRNNFLVLGEGPTEGINNSVGAAEKNLALTLIKQIQNFA